MKKIVKILIIMCLLPIYNLTSAFDEYIYTNNNKEKSILIEKYLIEHKQKIINFTIKYDVINDIEINKNIEKINFLIESLQKIQYNNIEKDREDLIINTILNEIKKINELLKIQLKDRKDNYENRIENKKNQYSNLWIKLASSIDRIIKSFDYLNKIESYKLTSNENQLKKSVKNLNDLSTILKLFSKINFDNEKDIEDTFLKIILEIRKEMNVIKQNI